MPQSDSSLPTEVATLAYEGGLGETAAYGRLTAVLATDFCARAERMRFFPTSVLREAFRQYLRQHEFAPSEILLLYQVFADAALFAMTSSALPGTARVGVQLREAVSQLDGADAGMALLLRLLYIVGLTQEEISTLYVAAGGSTVSGDAISALRREMQTRGLPDDVLLQQNLGPRGEVTLLLEKVRDGQQPLGEVIAHEVPKLLRQASAMLRLESGNISLEPADLVNEMFLRMPKDAQKSPVNHRQFEALAKRIMRHVLIDRARRPLPTQSRYSEELREDRASPSDLVEDRVMMQEIVQIVDTVIKDLRQTHPETAEMLRGTLYNDVDQQTLARRHGVSLSTVKRRLKDGREMIRKRLEVEPTPVSGSPRKQKEHGRE